LGLSFGYTDGSANSIVALAMMCFCDYANLLFVFSVYDFCRCDLLPEPFFLLHFVLELDSNFFPVASLLCSLQEKDRFYQLFMVYKCCSS
jgi:hypothetical protein